MSFKISKMAILVVIFLFSACHSDSSQEEAAKANSGLTIPEDINLVVGIGKITPEGGIINLATEQNGLVKKVFKTAGDSVQEGERILLLDDREDQLNIRKVRQSVEAQRLQNQADEQAVKQYKIQIEDKLNTLETSKKLMLTGAETKEVVSNQQAEYDLLRSQLNQSEKQIMVGKTKLKELQAELALAQNKIENGVLKAVESGVLLTVNAKVGEALSAYEIYATLAPIGPSIVEGEVDEMFANRLSIGQKVSIHYLGHREILGNGNISFLSPDLRNKSLFNEDAGEQQDRRVRRFEVTLDSVGLLLWNSKVECNIYLN